jgi:ABC-2 type transport system ATP-binding protein
VQGPNAGRIVEPLKQLPGILSVAAFGNALHVAGRDENQVWQALQSLPQVETLTISPEPPDLEDVFISLIASARDNFADAAA